MRVVVNTPNSRIGRPLSAQLLDAGAEVIALSRNPDAIADLLDAEATLVTGAMDDEAALDRAFRGADAVFWLTPPPHRPDHQTWVVETARMAAEAAKRHGVKRAVILSSIGAQFGSGNGPVGTLLAVEDAFRAALPNVLALRAGFFFENLLNDVGSLAKMGTMFVSAPTDYALPWVGTADIATLAAALLLDESWSGHVYTGAHGPEDLSYNAAVEIVGEALGQAVNLVPVSLDDARQGMMGAGMPGWMADLYLEIYAGMAEGRMDPAEPRTAQSTTPTSLAAFAGEVLAPRVQAARA